MDLCYLSAYARSLLILRAFENLFYADIYYLCADIGNNESLQCRK